MTEQRKRGAPVGSFNALKNGTRVHRLIIGSLPKQLSRVQRYAREYRRGLEAAVTETHKEVSITMAHHIDAACAHEQHCQVCRWLLRERIDTMATADIRECSKQMANAKDARNRAVALLELDRDPVADGWAVLDADSSTPAPTEAQS